MKLFRTSRLRASRFVLLALIAPCFAHALEVLVTIQNLAPAQGGLLTPVWVGFHNGTFDLYDSGAPVSMALERLAEDGNTAPLSTAFVSFGAGAMDGTILGSGGAIVPGETASQTFSLVPTNPLARYFSYASMVIPSNDAFVANGNPLAHSIFDGSGNFLGADFYILGNQVLDAGSEVNDEIPANTAAFGQAMPNTGVVENGVVRPHLGFMPAGAGGILSTPQFANANFLADGYQVARITVTSVPSVPDGGATLPLMLVTLLGLLWAGARGKSTTQPDLA